MTELREYLWKRVREVSSDKRFYHSLSFIPFYHRNRMSADGILLCKRLRRLLRRPKAIKALCLASREEWRPVAEKIAGGMEFVEACRASFQSFEEFSRALDSLPSSVTEGVYEYAERVYVQLFHTTPPSNEILRLYRKVFIVYTELFKRLPRPDLLLDFHVISILKEKAPRTLRLGKLVVMAKADKVLKSGRLLNVRDKAICELLRSGIPVSQLAGLRRKDLAVEKGVVVVKGKWRIPADECLGVIKFLESAGKERLFPSTKQAISLRINEIWRAM